MEYKKDKKDDSAVLSSYSIRFFWEYGCECSVCIKYRLLAQEIKAMLERQGL